MSGVIRVKVFCCVFYFGRDWVFLEYECPKRWFPGLFYSVGRSVDDKWVGVQLAKVVIHKKLIVCVCVICINNYGTVLTVVIVGM